MFSLSGDKIRPIVSLDLDGMDDGFFHCKKENCPDPFLFLKKEMNWLPISGSRICCQKQIRMEKYR